MLHLSASKTGGSVYAADTVRHSQTEHIFFFASVICELRTPHSGGQKMLSHKEGAAHAFSSPARSRC